MAGFFTLPELRAELQTMGHDDIPDDLICAFLSQLQLTQVPNDEELPPKPAAKANVLPVSNPKPYVYGSDAPPSQHPLPKSSCKSGAVSKGLPVWEPDYLISAFDGKWEEEFSLGFQSDLHRDWGFSRKSHIRDAGFPPIPGTQVEHDAIECKQQVFKEWRAVATRGDGQKTVGSFKDEKPLGGSASTQLVTVEVSNRPDEAKENNGNMMGNRPEALVRHVLQPCEDLMQELCPQGKSARTNGLQDNQYMRSDIGPKCPWEPMKDPEECPSGSLLQCDLATPTIIAETVSAASESGYKGWSLRQDDSISQTHYNFRAVKPACLQENCLMGVNCIPADRASLMDVSNYGQKKSRTTASCQLPNPETDGREIGGLVLEQSCLKYAEGCSGSVSKSSKRSSNRRGPGTHQCTACLESQDFKLDLSFGPAIENPLFDSERHFSCQASHGLQKCPLSTQMDSSQILLKTKPANVVEVRKKKYAQEIHINEDSHSPIKHTVSTHSPSPSKMKRAPFSHSSIKENLDLKQTPSPSKQFSHKQSPFSPSLQRKRYQQLQDVSSPSPSCKSATNSCDASPTVGNTKSQAKGRVFSQIKQQEMSPPRRGGKIDRVARFAEMQELWKNDSFLRSTATKRRPQSFHRIFATLHAIEASEQRSYKQQQISNKNLK